MISLTYSFVPSDVNQTETSSLPSLLMTENFSFKTFKLYKKNKIETRVHENFVKLLIFSGYSCEFS